MGASLLLGYCAAMFLGAYLSGWVTTAMQSSRSTRLNRWLAIFGAGLLVGTALIVIIPEGVAMYYEALKLQEESEHASHLHSHLPPGTKVISRLPESESNARVSHLGRTNGRNLMTVTKPTELLDRIRTTEMPGLLELQGVTERVETPPMTTDVISSATGRRLTASESLTLSPASAVGEDGEGEAAAEDEEEAGTGDERAHSHTGHAHGTTSATAAASSVKPDPGSSKDQHHDHEEVEAGHSSHGHSHGGPAIGAALVLGFAFQLIVDRLAGGLHAHTHAHEHGHGAPDSAAGASAHATGKAVSVSVVQGGGGTMRGRNVAGSASGTNCGGLHGSPMMVGASTVPSTSSASSASLVPSPSVDGLSSSGTSGSSSANHNHNHLDAAASAGNSASAPVIVSDGGLGAAGGGGVAVAVAPGTAGQSSSAGVAGTSKGNSAFVGLITHAAVDGVALGAAVAEGDASLGLLVFMAIMLHKAPSSFGLASYLLHQGYSSSSVKARLAVFSSSAPIAALLTYAVLGANLFAYTRFSLAMCLLFSGGTFLYVATAHILPEIQAQGAAAGNASSSTSQDDDEGHRHHHGGGLSWAEIGILLGGLLLPLLLNGQHGH